MTKPKLHIMVIGDGPKSGTGFGEELRNIFYRLVQTGMFKVTWFALSEQGYPIDLPDSVFPDIPHKGATIKVVCNRGDPFQRGANVFPKHYHKYNPEIIFFMGDPYNISPYIDEPFELKKKLHFPFYMYCTLDGTPVNPDYIGILKQINVLITMTEWAQFEYVKACKDLVPAVIRHGINWNWWSNNKKIKSELRKKYRIPEDVTLFINWDVNQHRKRPDALLRCWRDFHPETKNALLLLYTDWNMEEKLGWNIENLIKEYNVPRQTVISPLQLTGIPKYWEVMESPETIREIARLGDIYVSTTSGEGFGKCGLEAMSLGIPVIITDYAASSEVHQNGSVLVPCYDGRVGKFRYQDKIRGVEGGLVNEEKFTEAMIYLYQNKEERLKLGKGARRWAREFDYDTVIVPQWIKLFNSISPEQVMLKEMGIENAI